MTDVKRLLRVDAGLGDVPWTAVDPGRLRAGEPRQAANNQFSNARGNFHCGVWSSTEGCWDIRYTEDEFCYLIDGEAEITDAAGEATTVRPGDAFVIPAGFCGTWRTIGQARKFYAVYEEP